MSGHDQDGQLDTDTEIVERLERDLERWWQCHLTSDQLAVRLRHAATDLLAGE